MILRSNLGKNILLKPPQPMHYMARVRNFGTEQSQGGYFTIAVYAPVQDKVAVIVIFVNGNV